MNSNLVNGRKRFGRMARLRPDAEAEYDRLHAEIWPEVLAAIRCAGIGNYSLFRHGRLLFSYFELAAEADFEEAMRIMLNEPACRRWETQMQALQQPSAGHDDETWWAPMKEVFHCS